MLEVTIKFKDENDDVLDQDEQTVEQPVETDFLSWINGNTYGPPALIAGPEGKSGTKAAIGERVLFVNTESVKTVEVERISD